jgi:hypothetical protein
MAILPKSILKPEGSIVAGIATGALVIAIYQMNVGNVVQIHMTPASDRNACAARKKAAIQAVAAVSAISLLTKDATIFILGGGIVFLLDWHVRHAICSSPDTGQLVAATGYGPPTDYQAQASAVNNLSGTRADASYG